MMLTVDIVVAVRNEEQTLSAFIDSVRALRIKDVRLKMLFVEDGSTDKTIQVLKDKSARSDDIAWFSVINTYGQGVALSFGIQQSNADALITMDVDGSHPVSVASEMVLKYLEGYEIVQGNRIVYVRKSLYRELGSRLYFTIFTLLTGVALHKQNVHFRLMSRQTAEQYTNNLRCWFSARLKKNILARRKITYLDFEAPERHSGQSKFNFRRLFSYAYRSFITLCGIWMFILLNLLYFAAALIVFRFLGILPFLLLLLAGFLNIIYYIRTNSIVYSDEIRILESHNIKK